MKPTNKEIIKRINALEAWCTRADAEELTSTGKRALAQNLAMTVELIRRKYDLTSAYYSPAEYQAYIQYTMEYEDGKV